MKIFKKATTLRKSKPEIVLLGYNEWKEDEDVMPANINEHIRRVLAFGDPLHIDNLIVTHASHGAFGKPE